MPKSFKEHLAVVQESKNDPIDREIWRVDTNKKIIYVKGTIPAKKLEHAKRMNPGFKVKYE